MDKNRKIKSYYLLLPENRRELTKIIFPVVYPGREGGLSVLEHPAKVHRYINELLRYLNFYCLKLLFGDKNAKLSFVITSYFINSHLQACLGAARSHFNRGIQ